MRGFRYVFTFFACLLVAILYGFKVCMSLALVKMVNHTAVKIESNQPYDANRFAEDGIYVWNTTIQQTILLSYFVGYLLAQLPGGLIVDSYGAKWVLDFAIFTNVTCFLLIPTMVKADWICVVVIRIIMGLGGGLVFPATHRLLTAWAPKNEKTLITSLVYCGTSLGVMIANLLTGIISKNWSWEPVFYVFGGFGLLVTIGWSVLIGETPQKQKTCITQQEKDYIVESTGGDYIQPSLPWKAVFTSKPFWAILLTHTFGNVSWYLFIIEIPMFASKVLDRRFEENTVDSSVPYLFLWTFTIIFGAMMDKLIEKQIITISVARKLATGTGSLVPGCCLLIICSMTKENKTVIMLLIYISIMTRGAMLTGHLCNHMDIAPPFAATLIGITNTFATIPGIMVPVFIGILTKDDEKSFQPWRIVFYTTVGFIILEILIFSVFGSGEVQPWAKVE